MPAGTNLKFALPVNRVTDDTSTVGGAIDASGGSGKPGWKPLPGLLSSNGVVELVGDTAGDVRTVTVKGLLADGTPDQEDIVANGTTVVQGLKTWNRVEEVSASATHATRSLTVRRTGNSGLIVTLGPDEKAAAMLFRRASSSSVDVDREEVAYGYNDAADTLLDAKVQLLNDNAGGAAVIMIALNTAKGNIGTLGNRLTATYGFAFTDDGTKLAVPAGFLGPGERIAVVIQQLLTANHAPILDDFTLELSGTSIS